jgi:hypothetical protein
MAPADDTTPPAPASRRRLRERVLFLGGGYALYISIYTAGILASRELTGVWWALLWSVVYSLPETLAAPLVLDLAASARVAALPSRRRSALWLLSAVAFTAWSIVGGQLVAATMTLVERGVWTFTLWSPFATWKSLLSLLIFTTLAGLASAGARSREARAAEARAQRAETLRAEARLAVLRAQLNPHFILNVLHSLVGLAQRNPALTAAALERLGTTLRYALRVQSRAVDTVPLRDELAFTVDYLELERLRLGDRLETRFAVADALLDRTVPSFVLQPLVENSIRHAIAPRSRGGVVAIAVEERNGWLALSVDDDGADPAADGAQPRRDDSGEGWGRPLPRDGQAVGGTGLRRDPAEGVGWVAAAGSARGVGLRLLRDRLDALYGDAAALELGRSALGGFRAVIRIERGSAVRGEGE